MEGWAAELGLGAADRQRWRAAGILHDALRDAPPETLRPTVEGDWPDKLLHGPACAARLRKEGVTDEELLLAVSFHSVGHPEFGDLGRFLFLADFLEPGRSFLEEERAALRARLPADRDGVLADVIGMRLTRLFEQRRAVHIASVEFWNRVVGR